MRYLPDRCKFSKFPSLITSLFLLLSMFVAIHTNSLLQQEPDPEEIDYPALPEYVHSIAWSPDGNFIAVGIDPDSCGNNNNDYSIRILDAQTPTTIINQLDDYQICSADDLDWNSDGTKLVSSSFATVVWDMLLGERISYRNPPVGSSYINAWKPNSDLIASIAPTSPNISIWNALTGQEIKSIPANRPYSIAWHPMGTQLASSGRDGIKIWDSATWQVVKTIATGSITQIAWSPDATRIAGVVDENVIRIWNAQNGRRLATIRGHTDWINDLKWRQDSVMLASASYDGTLRIWNAPLAHEVQKLTNNGRVTAVDWSPDGSQLIYGGLEKNLTQSTLEVISLTQILGLVAHAGYDTWYPVGSNGLANVTLDGSLSQDTLGTIQSYTWTKDGEEIGNGVTKQIDLPLGSHEFVLTIRDSSDLTDSDSIIIHVLNLTAVPTLTSTPTITPTP